MKPCLAELAAIDHARLMRITDKAIDEFMAKYREEFGEEISRSEASEMAFRLVTLYETLANRLPNDTDCGLPNKKPHRPIGFQV